jgi:hypothetical protein
MGWMTGSNRWNVWDWLFLGFIMLLWVVQMPWWWVKAKLSR